MDPAEPGRDYRDLVLGTYDRIAADYNNGRLAEQADALALTPLIERLPASARVLDLGCGAGVPITQALAGRFDVTGVDFSSARLALARKQVPAARFIEADMMSCELAAASFDAVVSFFAIFHLPREEHGALFSRVHDWLKPGGYLLATLALADEAGYTEDDFHGATMYWSNFDLAAYRRLLGACGFEFLADWLLRDDPATTSDPEVHPVVLARKPPIGQDQARGREE